MDSFYFSVIIPAYKDNVRLNLCLKALIAQTLHSDEFEVIVVNNDPNESAEIDAIYFKKLSLKVSDEKTPGSYAARNLGIKLASAKILALTDSDCIPDPDWLLNAKRYFEADKDFSLGILAGDVPLFFLNDKKLTYAEIYEKYTGFDFKSYVAEGTCGAGNWFSYKKTMEEFGGFDHQLKSNGDTDLSGRISKKYRIVFAPEVIVRHPSRYHVNELVYKYRRLLGGTYKRKFEHKPLPFLKHLINFSFRRVKFSAKKFFTVPPKESWAIFAVCVAITIGAWKEYFFLIRGHETKR
ncbi:glycosyltransferase [Cognataquiflexum aquatile]|uniref:glycosyltransferase n=1 Tax=Cognataquiflexum aquatile TaxID=2249427 RepID=UPI000DEA2649|nr:glycosyltransferase family A protein [Cognataquiflexum aquatile]